MDSFEVTLILVFFAVFDQFECEMSLSQKYEMCVFDIFATGDQKMGSPNSLSPQICNFQIRPGLVWA
jgi:hypothetical protein